MLLMPISTRQLRPATPSRQASGFRLRALGFSPDALGRPKPGASTLFARVSAFINEAMSFRIAAGEEEPAFLPTARPPTFPPRKPEAGSPKPEAGSRKPH